MPINPRSGLSLEGIITIGNSNCYPERKIDTLTVSPGTMAAF